MTPPLTCPDCSVQILDAADVVTGRRVHRLTVRDDGTVDVDRSETVTLRRCANCDIVVGVS